MKAITLHQPWATLVAIGAKRIETRPSPPNGPMRPAGVRGYPGLTIEPGERIAIHAAARPATEGLRLENAGALVTVGYLVQDGRLLDLCNEETHPLPLGRLVATASVTAALPILEGRADLQRCLWLDEDRRLHEVTFSGERGWRLSDRESDHPLGDYRPGRWGWLLADVQAMPQPTPRIPGRQGVWSLP